MKNTIPLGVVQGPSELKQVHTWFKPLKDELDQINEDGGSLMRFYDGQERSVRVHIILFTGDEPAVAKMAGLKGHNSKVPCHHCTIKGVYTPMNSHVYYPTRCEVEKETSSEDCGLRISLTSPTEVTRIYGPTEPPMRTRDEIEIVFRNLDDRSLSKWGREKISNESGMKKRTVPLQFQSCVPYVSFPPDVMHKFMNICHDLMAIYRGNFLHLATQNLDATDKFVMSSRQWKLIDEEMSRIKTGTSASVFPEVPRVSKYSSSWKAAECVEFITNYALIILEGRLPRRYLKNLSYFAEIVELCRRPSLSQENVNRLKNLCVLFVTSFENLYYRTDPKRVGVCKSTIHTILHLGWAVEQCGPQVYCSQFWVERYIGEIKGTLHATRLAAESLNENIKSVIRTRMHYEDCFEYSRRDEQSRTDCADGEEQNQGVVPLSPWDRDSLTDAYHSRMKTRELLM